MGKLTLRKYISIIYTQFIKSKKEKISRFDIKWGQWSADMNRELKVLCEGNTSEALSYRYVFIYWSLLSQLLELYYKFRMIKGTQKRKLWEQGQEISKAVLSGDPVKYLSMDDLVKSLTSVREK